MDGRVLERESVAEETTVDFRVDLRTRCLVVALSKWGYDLPDIARLAQCDDATARYWVLRYITQGYEGLEA
jgi:hypothetical protein